MGERRSRGQALAALLTLFPFATTAAASPPEPTSNTNSVEAAPSRLVAARGPQEFTRLTLSSLPFDSDRAPHTSAHHSGVLRGGTTLDSGWVLGATALWSFTRIRLESEREPLWLRGASLAPVVGFDADSWCLRTLVPLGYYGEEWNEEALRLLPAVLGCWAPSARSLLQAGVGSVIRPESNQLFVYPILGWSLRANGWDTQGLLPFWLRATVWLTPAFGVGVQAQGDFAPHSTTLSDARQITLMLPNAGARFVLRPRHGLDLGLTLGATLDTLVTTRDTRTFDAPRLQPVVQLDVNLDDGLLR